VPSVRCFVYLCSYFADETAQDISTKLGDRYISILFEGKGQSSRSQGQKVGMGFLTVASYARGGGCYVICPIDP